MTKRYRGWSDRTGLSDAQSNANAMARREFPHTKAHRGSVSFAWDWQKREPRDLRDAVRIVRKAYEDEVPRRMTEGPDSIGDDGTPRFSSQAEGYIFGSPSRTDAGHDTEDRPLVSYYQTPFRATLAHMEHGPEPESRRAAIVRHVTIGSQGPQEAAIAEGVPVWCAKTVAEDAIRSFIRRLSDVRVDVAKDDQAA